MYGTYPVRCRWRGMEDMSPVRHVPRTLYDLSGAAWSTCPCPWHREVLFARYLAHCGSLRSKRWGQRPWTAPGQPAASRGTRVNGRRVAGGFRFLLRPGPLLLPRCPHLCNLPRSYTEFSLLSLSCSDYLSLPSVGLSIKNRMQVG